MALFADDSKLYRTLDSSESSMDLQHDLGGLRDWSIENSMMFNSSKRKSLPISKKKSPRPEFRYHLNGHLLECVPYIKDLGVTVSSDLTWTRHIEEITAKANRTLGLVQRVCNYVDDIATRRLLYCSLVRPQLEYCSCVWSPHTAKHRALIENVQRRATKFILKYPPRNVSYAEKLVKLSLLPLENRRSIKLKTL